MKNKFLLPMKNGLTKTGVSFFIILFPLIAQASSFGDDGSFSLVTALSDLIGILSGTIGGAVCVLAITCVGYGWLHSGRIEKGPAIVAIVGISVIFSAAWIANTLGFISS